MTKAITIRYSNEIKKAADVLFNCFNINQFYFCQISSDGSYSSLNSDVIWADYFASEKLYLNYPYFCDPIYQKPGISIIREAPNEFLKEVVDAGRDKFNFQIWFRVVSKTSDGIEEYGFSSPSCSDSQATFLLNESKLLHLFIKKFREKNGRIFHCIKECKINIANLIGPAFHQDRASLGINKTSKRELLKKMGIEPNIFLTGVEVRVIKLVLQGYSASQIAAQIFRSERTIEHHVERIKDKFACTSKVELIQKANELNEFGLLENE